MASEKSIRKCSLENIDPIVDLGRLVGHLRERIVSHIDEALAPMELTAAQYIIVVNLAQDGIGTPSALCALLEYDRGAMCRLLQRMEDKGLIKREPNVEDRRSICLELTEKGQRLYPEILPTVTRIYQQAMDGFSEQEQKTLASLLYRAIGNL